MDPARSPPASTPSLGPAPSPVAFDPNPSQHPAPSLPDVLHAAPPQPRPEDRFDPRGLDGLRSRLEAMFAGVSNAPAAPRHSAAPAPRDDAPLPFNVECTSEGPLHVRTVRVARDALVGRVLLYDALGASPAMLGLLALDPRLGECDPRRALYLDTETTGLNKGAGTLAFLVGLAFWSPAGELVCEQLLVPAPGHERPVLARIAERLRSASMVVTFNGKSFDVPLLRARFGLARFGPVAEPPHLDLLHVARRIHKARAIRTRLGELERHVLGFIRENDVPSAQMGALYMHFVQTGDARALHGVVHHNEWDVLTMVALVALYGESLERSQLDARDWVGAAQSLHRAGRADDAAAWADKALSRGGGVAALRACAELAKARSDKARALADFEALSELVDCPRARLELAKLYEHYEKDVARALRVVAEGTAETDDERARRHARLVRKAQRGPGESHEVGSQSVLLPRAAPDEPKHD